MFTGLLPFAPDRPAESLLPETLVRRLGALPPGIVRRAGTSLWLPARALQPWLPCDDTQWHVDPLDGTLIAFWGRLDNREALAGRWGASLRESGTTDAQCILAGWRRDESALVDHLLGEFAFVVVAPVARSIMLARDPLGVRPISYRLTGDGLWVGSSLPLLRSLVRDPTPPDSDWIRRYLLQQSWHHTRTAYSEISRLASGHTLTIRAGAAPVLRRWFAWRDDAPAADRRDERWVALYREALDRAVRRRWDGDAPVASENSAGIDSAAITAVLARQIPDVAGRLVSVGVAHFDTESLDILGLSRALGLRHNHVLTQLDANADATEIRNVLRVLGHPEENGAGTGMTPLHEICRLMGVRHLFSGFGGDEAASHSAYHLRRELLDRRQHRALFDILPGNAAARALRFGRAVWTGLPTMQQGLLHRQETGTPLPFLSRFIPAAEIERLGIESDALATLRAREGCRSVNASVIGPELGSPHVASRLESCTLVAAMRGLQYHWPLLDVELIQQYLSTPAIEKGGPRGMGRYLHRRAMDPRIPARITWRVKKDTGQTANVARLAREAQSAGGERARRLEAELHPQLAEIVARNSLHKTAERALAGTLQARDALRFQRFTHALAHVNLWLTGLDDGSLEGPP